VESNKVKSNRKMGTGQNTKKSRVTIDNGENNNLKGEKKKLKGGKTRGLKNHSMNEMNEDFKNHFTVSEYTDNFYFSSMVN
jgi:hypothetical protein